MSHARERRFRFGLINLFGAITALALALAWIAYVERHDSRQMAVIHTLRPFRAKALWREVGWLRHSVRTLSFPRSDQPDALRPTDDDLRHIEVLYGLQWLDLSDTNITDATLERVANLPSLQHLNLTGTAVSDAGIGWLSRMRQLQELDVGHTQISWTGAEQLSRSLPRTMVIWKSGRKAALIGSRP
jgi:hypothetical protein